MVQEAICPDRLDQGSQFVLGVSNDFAQSPLRRGLSIVAEGNALAQSSFFQQSQVLWVKYEFARWNLGVVTSQRTQTLRLP